MLVVGPKSIRSLPSLSILVFLVSIGSLLYLLAYFRPRDDFLVLTNAGLGGYDVNAVRRGNLNHNNVFVKKPEPWDSSRYILGPPTARFRDNLRNDTFYITTWSSAGFTNQFIGYVNLIYLAINSGRVPIMAPFAPDHHIAQSAGILPFGEVFNLTHLRSALRMPILDWSEVKDLPPSTSLDPYSTSEVEQIGCWSTRKANEDNPIRAENVVHHLGLDVAYTRVPTFTRKFPSEGEGMHVVFHQLSAAIFPRKPIAPPGSYPHMSPSPLGSHLPPEEQLSCFDVLYYMTSGAEVYEWRFLWSPAWRFVGQHVRFNEVLVDRARDYLRTAFGLGDGEEIPQFIAIHIRRGDFAMKCLDSPGNCLTPLSTFSKAVNMVRNELIAKRDLSVTRFLVASDETNPVFWKDVMEMGWNYIDHAEQRTVERFGIWHAPLVDIVAQSLAIGFVGTYDSTFSLVSGRRVEDWNGGVFRVAKSGD